MHMCVQESWNWASDLLGEKDGPSGEFKPEVGKPSKGHCQQPDVYCLFLLPWDSNIPEKCWVEFTILVGSALCEGICTLSLLGDPSSLFPLHHHWGAPQRGILNRQELKLSSPLPSCVCHFWNCARVLLITYKNKRTRGIQHPWVRTPSTHTLSLTSLRKNPQTRKATASGAGGSQASRR